MNIPTVKTNPMGLIDDMKATIEAQIAPELGELEELDLPSQGEAWGLYIDLMAALDKLRDEIQFGDDEEDDEAEEIDA